MRAMFAFILPGNLHRFRTSLVAALLVTLLTQGTAFAREPAQAESHDGFEFAVLSPFASEALSRSSATNNVAPATKLGSFGQGMLDTASTLTFALTDGVKDTVRGTASLAGAVSGAVTDTVKNTVSGTVNVAGAVGGAVGNTVRSTMAGTTNAAGAVGNAVGGAVKSTVIGTLNVAGTVTGIVTDTVKNTVVGTVNVAGAMVGGVGSTVTDVARSLLDAPQRMIQYATTMLGTPYKWGGNTIESGLDCSGFVREVVQSTTGKLLPRTAREMSNQGTQVAYSEMKPGDLVFFNTRRKPFSHVGIYLGDGRFMHGASGVKSGKQVRIDSFNSTYYRSRFNGARRVADTEQIAGGAEIIGNTALGLRPTMN